MPRSVQQCLHKSVDTEAEFWGAVRTVVRLKRRPRNLPQQAQNRFWSPLVALQPYGNRSPFFLVSGGAARNAELLLYAKLAPYLSPDQPFYGLKARGHEKGEKPHNQIEAMAADYIKSIRRVQPQGPYLLGGECIGGVVAFEMAQQLIRIGQSVSLILLDTRAPIQGTYHFKTKHSCSPRISLLRTTINSLMKIFSLDLKNLFPYLLHKTRRVIKLLIYRNERSLREAVTRGAIVAESYCAAISSYRPQAYLGKVVCIVSEGRDRHDPTLGWKELVAGGVEVHIVHGNHSSYIREFVQHTGSQLAKCLQAASDTNPGQ